MNKFFSSKCSVCGCTGIHACLGNTKKSKLFVVNKKIGMYNTLAEAINHIRKSEEKRSKRGQKNDRNSSSG